MKKFSYLLLMLLLPAFVMVGCDKGGDDGDKQIELPNQSEQTQQAYADEETTGGFTFTAKSEWTATVSEVTRASGVSWLRLLYEGVEKYDGDAGTFTLAIELDANPTGETRSATIVIKSGNDTITVSVTQDGKTENGVVPEKPRTVINITETASFNSDYYSSENERTYNPFYYEFKYDDQNRLKEYYVFKKNDGSRYNKVTLSYDVQGEIKVMHDLYGEERKYIAELNASGNVSKITYQYDSWTVIDFEYNSDGYMSKAIADVVEEGKDDIVFNWSNANLVSFHFNGEKGGTATFAPELNNKVNIDLNAFIFGLLENDELFEYSNDLDENILAMADRFGKRSRNYMTSRELYTEEAEFKDFSQIFTADSEPETEVVLATFYDRNFYGEGSYTFDNKGCPTAFTRQVEVEKKQLIYKGKRTEVAPDKAEEQDWLDRYGPGPYFRTVPETETTTLYDTYTYQITYKE